jgi:hypothetical protein
VTGPSEIRRPEREILIDVMERPPRPSTVDVVTAKIGMPGDLVAPSVRMTRRGNRDATEISIDGNPAMGPLNEEEETRMVGSSLERMVNQVALGMKAAGFATIITTIPMMQKKIGAQYGIVNGAETDTALTVTGLAAPNLNRSPNGLTPLIRMNPAGCTLRRILNAGRNA